MLRLTELISVRTSRKPHHQVELGTRRLNLSIVTVQLWC